MTMSAWEQVSDGLLNAIVSFEERAHLIVCLRDDDRVYVQFA